MRTWFRRRRNRWIASAAALGIAAAAAVAIASSTQPRLIVVEPPSVADVPSITATGLAPHEVPSIVSGIAPGKAILTSMVDTLNVFDAPNGTITRDMSRYTYYSIPLTLMAIEDRDVAGVIWYQVLVPAKPNGQTGWVRASDVSVTSTDTVIRVYLAEHELDLVVDGKVTMTERVAVGAPATPTPLGTFYITDPIDLSADPSTVYGSYALGLSGYSEALDSFKGTVPQIAIHGTDQPNLIGQSVSNGCIHLENGVITDLAARVGLGTPVIISASRTQT